MKNLKIYMIYTFYTAIALTATAASPISNIVVNQRWPWNEKVDVDFILSGDAADVDVAATWDSHPAPYGLGTLFAAAPGRNRFTWDPAESKFAGQTLTGFTVTLSNVVASAHAYLVVDLANGGYSFLPDIPADGWTSEYKSSKMVFRRIPAGTYTLGEEYGTFEYLRQSSPAYYADICNRRTVTFTGDFYVGIFKFTRAQYACLVQETQNTDYTPMTVSYDELRGSKAGDNVDWPATMYKVATDSVVAKLRAKAGLVADLCEEEQWEVAARAGTATFWPTGGTTADSFSACTNYVNEFVAWYGNTGTTTQKAVATRAHNGWGLYDVVGLAGEWTLDTTAGSGSVPAQNRMPDASVDPVGMQGYVRRVLRSANGNGAATGLNELLPCRRQLADPSSKSYSTRFCIHLKPLGNLTF